MRRTSLALLVAALVLAAPAGATVALVQDLGIAYTGSGTNVVITVPAGGVAAGDLLHVDATVASSVSPMVADSRGNTYTLVAGLGYPAAGFTLSSFWCVVGTALLPGETITVSWAGTAGGAAGVAEYSGVTAAPLDRWGDALATSTVPSASTIFATTQPNELVVGAFAVYGTNSAATLDIANFSPLSSVNFPVGATFMSLNREYRVVSATGVYVADGTLSPAAAWIAQVATYKDVTVPVELLRFDAR